MKMDGYWVYLHWTPDDFVYVGRSGRRYTYQRWRPSAYKHTSLYPHITKWGWDNIRHFFIDGLTKEESYQLEDKFIRYYKELGVCINKIGSGGLQCDGNYKEYSRQYREANRDEVNSKQREYRAAHREEYNAKQRARIAANRDERNAKRRAKRAANREEYNAKQRERIAANREEYNAKRREYQRTRYTANRDEINAKRRAKRAAKKHQPYTYGDPLF